MFFSINIFKRLSTKSSESFNKTPGLFRLNRIGRRMANQQTLMVWARSERDGNLNSVNIFCILCAACGVGEVLTLMVISVLTRGVLEDHCRTLRCLTALFVTMSRCSCHFVFHSRWKTLNRNDVAIEKLSVSLYFIVAISSTRGCWSQRLGSPGLPLSFADDEHVGHWKAITGCCCTGVVPEGSAEDDND